MEKERIERLLDKILEASKNNKIEWEKNTKTESAFKANLGDNTVHIIGTRSNYTFIIMSDYGDKISELDNLFIENTKLKELHEIARIKALRINENLDEIDSYLDSLL